MKHDNLASRRNFIKTSGIATMGFIGLSQFVNPAFAGRTAVAEGYGDLLADPKKMLNLPKGFSYQIISKRGDRMDDGFLVPGRADGMGAFPGKNGRVILVRNHENNPDSFDQGAFGLQNELLKKLSPDKLYENGKGNFPALGGTTTLVYDPVKKRVEKEFLSLAGTVRNCAGGVTPWNSWLTCEESTLRKGAYEGNLEKDHGYVFEVPASEEIGLAVPAPIKGMGRFNHEAVAVDPKTGIVYLTEDKGDGLFYRFIPNVKGKMLEGGKLQALGILGAKSRDTRNWEDPKVEEFPVGIAHDVVWIDMEDIESPKDDLRQQGLDKGAACFARGEGIWFGKKELYFACTNGGKIMSGQVFRYTPGPDEGTANEKKAPGKLELFAEPNDRDILKNCDNLAIAPWGDLVLCEDHPQSFIVGITPKGAYYKLAENVGFLSEMAGGVFSPSGDTFFVNLQAPGITLAINGPWR
jgi:secreted PhoX family phosphatase